MRGVEQTCSRAGSGSVLTRMVLTETCRPTEGAGWSYVDLGDSTRVALMLTPSGRGCVSEQTAEVLSRLESVLGKQTPPMAVTMMTVFLRDGTHQAEIEVLFREQYGSDIPAINYVLQPPCCGAALALEVWAIGGSDVRVQHFGPHALAVSYDSVRWVYCAGLGAGPNPAGVYAQAFEALRNMRASLEQAGTKLENAVRTWFYLGAITEPESQNQRYMELNRARTDFYRDVKFCCSLLQPNIPHGVYPASTGIGMQGRGLVASCLTLQTQRDDVFLLPLENPQQTPAYAYHPRYSPRSPKFSRAMALVLRDYLTIWISGTASIVNSESRHAGDIERQTEQTIDNIERLISPANLAFHGVKGSGPELQDLAKVRVYLKRQEDFTRCKAICERRFGTVPAIYAIADICRPELLVEIEGVAFSRRRRASAPDSDAGK
jgi:enamine deaminase RidA (YjgF/YER057c/UK114 family)